jgi:predicted permease
MTGWLARWRRRRRVDREIDEELAFHIEAATRDLVRAGVPADEARRRALADFGGPRTIAEQTREAGLRRWPADIAADLRYAARGLRQQPGFALVAILTLTLGIGANTAIFSLVNAVLLRPLPVGDPGGLVLFDDSPSGTRTSKPFPGGRWSLFSSASYEFLATSPLPFASIAAFAAGDYTGSASIAGAEHEIDVDFVSGSYFDTLRASAALGRPLQRADDRRGAAPVAVASDRFWRERLRADPAVVGRAILIDEVMVTVVGVMPAAFAGVYVHEAPDVWMPLSRQPGDLHARGELYWLGIVGRLAPGGTMAAAETAATSALRQFLRAQEAGPIAKTTSARIDSVHVRMADGARGISFQRGPATPLLVLLFSVVGIILLIACANVGTLLIARGVSREREVAVRRALGAGRGRLIRQWLTESLLLGAAGAACGAALAWMAAPRLMELVVPASIPIAATPDGRVFAFTAATTFLACLLFGLAPALSAGRVDVLRSLRLSGRSHRRRRAFGLAEPFVVAQVAMALVLVLAAALLVRTLLNLQRQPYGFDQENVLLVGINPRQALPRPDARGADRPAGFHDEGYDNPTVANLYRRIHAALAALPSVERVSFARYAPFSGSRSSTNATIDAHADPVALDWVLVGPEYPQTIGMTLVAGRALTLDDDAGRPAAAMVNEAFVERYFPDSSPIGRHFTLGAARGRSYEIVGVLEDAHFRSPREPVSPTAFVSMLQDVTGRMLDCEFELRTRGPAGAVAAAARAAIGTVDPKVEIRRVRTLADQVRGTFRAERIAAGFVAAFAALALLVAAAGLYGIVAHGLARRTNEIGIRRALGAARLDVVHLIARETMLRLGLGLTVGFALAWTSGHLLAAQLFGVTPTDAVSAVIAALVLSAVVALTTIRPLRRAMRVDPIVVLRAE